MGLKLKEFFKKKADENKIKSGQLYGENHSKIQEVSQNSAKPLEGEKFQNIDVREEVAKTAGVSHFTISQIEKIKKLAPVEIKDTLETKLRSSGVDKISSKHGLPFRTIEKQFETKNDVCIWMVQNQFARRNLTAYVHGELGLKLKEFFKKKADENLTKSGKLFGKGSDSKGSENSTNPLDDKIQSIDVREEVAKTAGVSSFTISQIEKIKKLAPVEIKDTLETKLRSSGTDKISINQAVKFVEALKDAPEASRGEIGKFVLKHNISFASVEHEFETRGDVLKWILDRQLDRRNLNNLKRTYLVGRRYLVEKNANGVYDHNKSTTDKLGQNDQARSSASVIGNQLSIGEKTVRRAADFTLALDTIVSNTGIAVNDILDGKIPSNQQSIIALAELDKDSQKRVIDLILQDERDTVDILVKM